MSEAKVIPEGFMEDHRGCLVPLELVRDVDRLRDQLVNDIVREAAALNEALTAFKRRAMAEVLAFVELSAERFDVKIGGTKGNITLTSYDGKHRVVRSINEHVTFDERLIAAKALLDDCLKKWTADTTSEIKKLIDFAFTVDKTGKISTGRVLGLMRVDIKDPLWKKAMKAVAESIQVGSSKAYIRVYRRVGGTDKYEQVNLDLAVL